MGPAATALALLLLVAASGASTEPVVSPYVQPPTKYLTSHSFRGSKTDNFRSAGQMEKLENVHDYIRLVPPHQSAHGSLFAEATLPAEEWIVEVAFRMHGESSVGGRGLAFWYTKGGSPASRTNDVSHSFFGNGETFDGMAVIFDATPSHPIHPLSSGILPPTSSPSTRGVMSLIVDDGTTKFLDSTTEARPESKYLEYALGECEGQFRNAPGIVWARISNFKSTIRVDMDLSHHNTLAKEERHYNYHCLSVPGIALPAGSYLGLSGLASPTTEPDAIDVYAMDVYEVLDDRSRSSHVGEPADTTSKPLEGTSTDPVSTLAHEIFVSQGLMMSAIDTLAVRVQELSAHLGMQSLTSSPAGIAGQLASMESRLAQISQAQSGRPQERDPTERSDSETLTHLLQIQERLALELKGFGRKLDSVSGQTTGSVSTLASRSADNLKLLQEISTSLQEIKSRRHPWTWILGIALGIMVVLFYLKSQRDGLDWRQGGKKMI